MVKYKPKPYFLPLQEVPLLVRETMSHGKKYFSFTVNISSFSPRAHKSFLFLNICFNTDVFYLNASVGQLPIVTRLHLTDIIQ